jgi:hypothetical protein
MSNYSIPFLQQSLAGRVMLDEIDDFIDEWHENPRGFELHDFLGMTLEEYRLWVAEPDTLAFIVKARHDCSSLLDVVNDNFSQYRLAARADDTAKIKQLETWLKAQGEHL